MTKELHGEILKSYANMKYVRAFINFTSSGVQFPFVERLVGPVVRLQIEIFRSGSYPDTTILLIPQIGNIHIEQARNR